MSLCHHLLRRSPPVRCISNYSTTTSHIDHQRNHEYLPPSEYLGSWKPPADPREAQSQLARLRREYAQKVKAVRKEYIREVEFMRLEKERKDSARKEALRIANEERRAAKEVERKARAKEREAADEEFRQTLKKERAEKLEYWRMRTAKFEEKKKEKKENVRRQSSEWVAEPDLQKKVMETIIDAPMHGSSGRSYRPPYGSSPGFVVKLADLPPQYRD